LNFRCLLSLLTLPLVSSLHAQSSYLEERLRIRSTEEPLVALTAVADIEVGGPHNLLFIAQPMSATVLVFRRDGTLRQSLGREGSGPGEFRRPVALGWKADRLWVWDASLGRFSLFGPDLAFERTALVPHPGVSRLLADGTVILYQLHGLEQRLGRPVTSSTREAAFVRLDPRNGHQDTILTITEPSQQLTITVGSGAYVAQQPFLPKPILHVSPRGDHVYRLVDEGPVDRAHGEFTLLSISDSGDTTSLQAMRYTLQPVDEARVNEWVDRMAENLMRTAPPSFGRPTISRAAVKRQLVLPDHAPPVEDIAADSTGVVWAKVHPGADPPARSTWRIFPADGSPERTVDGPPYLKIYRARADTVWGILSNAVDLPVIVELVVTNR
jgi:hypothetical protein